MATDEVRAVFKCVVLVAMSLTALSAYAGATPPRSSGGTVASTKRPSFEAATSAFHQALRTKDAEALLSYVADDVAMMPPGEAAVRGKAAMRAWYAAFLSQLHTSSLTLTDREVFIGEGWAVEMGTYEWGLKPIAGGEPIVDRGHYMQVWKPQPDGQWRFAREIRNSTEPPPASPAK